MATEEVATEEVATEEVATQEVARVRDGVAPASPSVVEPVASATDLIESLGLGAAVGTDGTCLTIAGYASLMDEASAKETSPTLRNFRYGAIRNHVRVFNLVSIINMRRGVANGVRLATATARPVDVPRGPRDLLVCLFEVPLMELPAMLARERRLRVCCVPYEEALGAADEPEANGGGDGVGASTGRAVLFGEYTHAEYVRERCGGDLAVYHEEVGQYYPPPAEIYRADLLPVPQYVLRIVRAHRLVGPAFVANLLDATFLGDGITSLRAYLADELATADEADALAQAGDWTPAERAELMAALSEAPAEGGGGV